MIKESRKTVILCDACRRVVCRRWAGDMECGKEPDPICFCKTDTYFSFWWKVSGRDVNENMNLCASCQKDLIKHLIGIKKTDSFGEKEFKEIKAFFPDIK